MIGFDGVDEHRPHAAHRAHQRRRRRRARRARRCSTTPTRTTRSARRASRPAPCSRRWQAAVPTAGARRRGRGRPVDAAPRPGAGRRVLLVDHQDSFVHTLADYFRQQGAEVMTLRAGFDRRDAGRVSPRTWSCCRRGRAARPTSTCDAAADGARRARPAGFGVCLGLQAMVEHAGGELGAAGRPRCTASPAGSGVLGGRAVRRAARPSSPPAATTRCTRTRPGARAGSRSPRYAGRRRHGDRGPAPPAAGRCSSTRSRS